MSVFFFYSNAFVAVPVFIQWSFVIKAIFLILAIAFFLRGLSVTDEWITITKLTRPLWSMFVAAMLEEKNNNTVFLWGKNFIVMRISFLLFITPTCPPRTYLTRIVRSMGPRAVMGGGGRNKVKRPGISPFGFPSFHHLSHARSLVTALTFPSPRVIQIETSGDESDNQIENIQFWRLFPLFFLLCI